MQTDGASIKEILRELVCRVSFSEVIAQLGFLAEDYSKTSYFTEQADKYTEQTDKWQKASENLKKLANNPFS